MLYLTRGAAASIPRTAFNDSGGNLDISSAQIVFNVKETALATSNIFQKLNTAAGGDDSQIKTISGSLYRINVLNTDTADLTEQDYYYEIVIDSQVNKYGIMRLQPATGISSAAFRTYGTTAERPVLPSDQFIGFIYFDTDLDVNVTWNGSSWV